MDRLGSVFRARINDDEVISYFLFFCFFMKIASSLRLCRSLQSDTIVRLDLSLKQRSRHLGVIISRLLFFSDFSLSFRVLWGVFSLL